jgi:hypothetical protein
MTTSEDERAAFEDHMRAQFPTVREDMFLDRTSDDSRYCSMVTEHAWRAWNAALSTQERPRSAMGDHGEGGYPTERAGEAVQRPAGDDRGAAIISDAADALAWHYENPHPKDATGRRQKQDARLALRLRSLVLPKSSS